MTAMQGRNSLEMPCVREANSPPVRRPDDDKAPVRIELIPANSPPGGDAPPWCLLLEGAGVTLNGPRGNRVAAIDRLAVERAFNLPSFSRSRNELRIRAGGKVYRFKPDRWSIKEIKRYLDSALERRGDEAIRALRKQGLA